MKEWKIDICIQSATYMEYVSHEWINTYTKAFAEI